MTRGIHRLNPWRSRSGLLAVCALLLVAGSLALLYTFRGSRSVPAGSRQTPVILISVDTLRADHLPAYGYKGVETPHIDEFRKDSILYLNAYSHCPLTLPSHTTMLTGLLPAEAQVRDNVGFVVPKSIATLPDLLKKNGYATGAAISAFVLRKETGINRGFDAYDDDVEALGASRVIGRIQRSGEETAAVAKKWISQNRHKPFFYFLHLYDPHTPYEPPEPFKSRYPVKYDGEIAYVDKVLGDFFAFLKDTGVYDKALIVFVSDHGEGLNDHQEEEHGMFLYREAIQVPLLVKLPGSSLGGESVATLVQLIDLYPTILAQTATKAPVPENARSLLEFIETPADRTVYSESMYPRLHYGWSDLHSMITKEHHYIHAPIPELYDLTSDPKERRNAVQENRRAFTRLRKAIEPLIKEASAPSAIDPEAAAKLAALGYLGSTVATTPGEKLPDPKEKIEDFRQLRVAFTLHRDERYAEALVLIDRLLERNPKMVDLWDLKSNVLEKLGRLHDAVDAAREALRLNPQASHIALAIANLYIKLEKPVEAAQHAELGLRAQPSQAHEILARTWILKGDLDNAEKEARLSLQGNSDLVSSWMTLGRIAKEREKYEQALQYFDRALSELKPKQSVTSLHFFRGDTFARMGRVPEAEAAFKEEIRLFPEEPQAYKNLILLYVTEGRTDEATRLIFQLVEKSPTPRSYLAVIDALKVIGDDRGVRYWRRRGLLQFPNDASLRASG